VNRHRRHERYLRKKNIRKISKRGMFAKDWRWCWEVTCLKNHLVMTDEVTGNLYFSDSRFRFRKATVSTDRMRDAEILESRHDVPDELLETRLYRTGYGARMAQADLGGQRNRHSVSSLGGWWDFRSLNIRKPSQLNHPKMVQRLKEPHLPYRKYVLCPGEVTSRSDGQRHYINAEQLLSLYGVRRNDCYIARRGKGGIPAGYAHLPRLFPRYEGDYKENLAREIREAEFNDMNKMAGLSHGRTTDS
jgi:hypothetical protein